MLKILVYILLIFIYIQVNDIKAYASTIFEDDFNNQYNSFPSGWTSFNLSNEPICNHANVNVANNALDIFLNGEPCSINIFPDNIVWGNLGSIYSDSI